MIWNAIHIIEIILWCIIACSVAYVVFFAIISLFYEKEDAIAIHASTLSSRMAKFLILYPAYKEDRVIINALEPILNPVLVAVFYGEMLGRLSMVGAMIVICGIMYYNLRKR